MVLWCTRRWNQDLASRTWTTPGPGKYPTEARLPGPGKFAEVQDLDPRTWKDPTEAQKHKHEIMIAKCERV